MIKNYLLLICLLGVSAVASAANIQLNQSVPAVSVTDKGELVMNNDGKLDYQPWKSQQLVGKVRTIQHIAGRSSAKELNAPLVEAIKQAKFPHDSYQTTTIINTDDAIFGTGVFVKNSVEDSKKEFPYSQFIVDSEGTVKNAWGLKPESSAIIVLDNQGKVLFFKDGELNTQEIQKVISLLVSSLNQ
ncbi:YtfJ family protein [Providencia hangzhouensis]|uniref:Predicted transcriptional regulator n=2 Tax=Providencia TaxID=586 RepID=A0A264VT84_PRORE|nr:MULTISPECIES: YtfJ family protein [Providencia]MBN6364244.1 YtfJ family protein [Providencia rettgeri]MBN7841670.1 YtfJ family protein [Providencia rettgeri]MBN7852450.1 YtfJ family protein [Providencia rettgeri]MBN7860867.1 YtfJ family protein [Providencia rettgeri]MBN7872896.1 YtfJ family protein [Providencia rettgeri]